jgi:hypothetical protein
MFISRVLAEFQSRKAQRILLRDKDLLKYLLLLIIIVVGYLVTWTVVTLDHTVSGDGELIVETRHVTGSRVLNSYCKLGWWHYVIEAGELNATVHSGGYEFSKFHLLRAIGEAATMTVAESIPVCQLVCDSTQMAAKRCMVINGVMIKTNWESLRSLSSAHFACVR